MQNDQSISRSFLDTISSRIVSSHSINNARIRRRRREEEVGTASIPTDQALIPSPIAAALEIIKPKVEKILGSEVELFYNEYRRQDFMTDPERRDHFVSGHGYTEKLGFIHINNNGGCRYLDNGSRGLGINVFKTRDENNSVSYAIITFPAQYGVHEVLAAPKGKVFALHRQWQRQKANHSEIKKPVLPDGLLEEVEKNTVQFLRNARKFKSYKISARRGLVLSGPPGNGKTMVCRYLRQLCDLNNISYNVVSASEIQQAFAQDCLENLMNYPGVLFLDDIDISIFSRRQGQGDDKLACAMLAAMDGMDNDGDCIRIFTTNEVMSGMDAAFKRPGRIDKVFQFDKPNAKMRRSLLETWPDDILETMDIEEATKETKNLSFAEIEGVKSMMVTSLIIDEKAFNFSESLEEMKDAIKDKDSGKAVKEKGSRRVGFTSDPDPDEFENEVED